MWMWAGVNRFNDLDMTLIGLHGLGCPSNNSAEHLDGTAEYLLLDVWTGSTTEVRGSLITGPIDPYQTKVYIISK